MRPADAVAAREPRTLPFRRPRLSFGIGPQVVAVVVVLGLAGAMAIQPTRQLLEQRARIQEMAEQLRQLRAARARLEAYLERLRSPDYIEQEARRQFGLALPGETAYIVMPPTRKDRRADRARGTARPERRAPPGFLERLLRFIGIG